ncbi:hypothetical protein AAH678_15595 [Sodalis endosymbiont of Spalangia cameroni]
MIDVLVSNGLHVPNTVYYHRRLAEGELPLDTERDKPSTKGDA